MNVLGLDYTKLVQVSTKSYFANEGVGVTTATQVITCSSGNVLKPVTKWTSRFSVCSGKGLLVVAVLALCFVGCVWMGGESLDKWVLLIMQIIEEQNECKQIRFCSC